MPDIFDTLKSEKQSDIFDQLSSERKESLRGGANSPALVKARGDVTAARSKTDALDPEIVGANYANARLFGIPGLAAGLMGSKIPEATTSGGKMVSDMASFAGGSQAVGDVLNVGKQAIKSVKDAGGILQAFKKSVHGEEFLKGASKNLRDMGNGLEGSLHKAYGEFYSANGLSDVPLESSKVDDLFLGNDLPKSTMAKIDAQIGKVDTIGKAHAARGIIRSDLSKNAFNNPSVDLTAEDIKKETMGDLKDLMRKTTRAVNSKATAKLEELDKLAYGDVYPRLLRINRLVSSDPLATEYPDTTKILSLMKGGLGKGFTQKIFSDSPEKIAQLDKYLDSPEFHQDVNKAVESSRKFSKAMDDFKGREITKKVAGATAGVAVAGGGIYEAIKGLFGK